MRSEPLVIGGYALFGELASGGMATVHYGRLLGEPGVSRVVAIKRLHAQFAADEEFVEMFTDEGRIASRIHHPNVVPTLDVVSKDSQLYLVMEYVHGETLARLLASSKSKQRRVPPAIAVAVAIDLLHGLEAAHEATDERGQPLGIVHRDVSPHNVMVGTDGVARVLDFGVAKATGRIHLTRDGQLKGKLTHMAPEQLKNTGVDRRTDVYAAAIVLWEALVGRALFDGVNEAVVLSQVMHAIPPPPSGLMADVPQPLDAIVLRGLERTASRRFPTAREMATALERTRLAAGREEIAAWVESLAGARIRKRAEVVARIEQATMGDDAPSEWPTLGAMPASGRVSYPSRARSSSAPSAPASTSTSTADLAHVPAALQSTSSLNDMAGFSARAASDPALRPLSAHPSDSDIVNRAARRRLALVVAAGAVVGLAALVVLLWPRDHPEPAAAASPAPSASAPHDAGRPAAH